MQTNCLKFTIYFFGIIGLSNLLGNVIVANHDFSTNKNEYVNLSNIKNDSSKPVQVIIREPGVTDRDNSYIIKAKSNLAFPASFEGSETIYKKLRFNTNLKIGSVRQKNQAASINITINDGWKNHDDFYIVIGSDSKITINRHHSHN